MKLCTIGLGYIGLPSSAMFADHGTDVVGVDIDPRIVKMLNAGDIHIEEPGLEDLSRTRIYWITFFSHVCRSRNGRRRGRHRPTHRPDVECGRHSY